PPWPPSPPTATTWASTRIPPTSPSPRSASRLSRATFRHHDGGMSREKSLKVLVVCLGNICRSPAGEAALREAAAEAGLDLEVDSAGTGPWHVGDPPNPQIRAAGERANLAIDG